MSQMNTHTKLSKQCTDYLFLNVYQRLIDLIKTHIVYIPLTISIYFHYKCHVLGIQKLSNGVRN